MSKYKVSPKSQRTVDGIVFDSKKEMNRYLELKMLEKSGAVSKVSRQVSFELQPSFIDNNGKKVRAITYVADFVYCENGKNVVEDVKSEMTRKLPLYKVKKKLFLYRYQYLYEFREYL